MILVKPGASLLNLRTEMAPVLVNWAFIMLSFGKAAVVTSGTDSEHAEHSFHYNGLAVDLRSHDLEPAEKLQAVTELAESLGPHYNVVLEHQGEQNEHVHVEFDHPMERPKSIYGRVSF